MIGHSDLMMIIEQLGKHFHCESILDNHHNTILHIAAASGRLELVRYTHSGISRGGSSRYSNTTVKYSNKAVTVFTVQHKK